MDLGVHITLNKFYHVLNKLNDHKGSWVETHLFYNYTGLIIYYWALTDVIASIPFFY